MDTGVEEIIMTEKDIYDKIDVLNKILWDDRALRPSIEAWLSNFQNDEKKQALYLLSRCMYFNHESIRYLLKALYRDKYRTPIIQMIRERMNGSIDEKLIESEFNVHLKKTRFLGVGNPSESGGHLLYYFRQENTINKDLFISIDDLLTDSDDVEQVVFIDDLCGSGSQVRNEKKLKECIIKLREKEFCPRISYFMLFGTTKGMSIVRNLKIEDCGKYWFDEVEAEMELNESYQCFGEFSRYFNDESEKKKSMALCIKYGTKLIDEIADRDWPKPLVGEKRDQYIRSCALGYGDCQLLLSLQHNTPNNTLPIFWFEEKDNDWIPIFKRYNKVYY